MILPCECDCGCSEQVNIPRCQRSGPPILCSPCVMKKHALPADPPGDVNP